MVNNVRMYVGVITLSAARFRWVNSDKEIVCGTNYPLSADIAAYISLIHFIAEGGI